jgi:hypothetical protein
MAKSSLGAQAVIKTGRSNDCNSGICLLLRVAEKPQYSQKSAPSIATPFAALLATRSKISHGLRQFAKPIRASAAPNVVSPPPQKTSPTP